jgi:hypothetical protein
MCLVKREFFVDYSVRRIFLLKFINILEGTFYSLIACSLSNKRLIKN